MNIGIISFKGESRTYKFKKPLMLESEYAEIREDKDSDSVEAGICLSHKGLSLSACGTSLSECEEIIREELAVIWEEYALAPDDELTPGAIVFKNKLSAMAEEVK